MTTVEKKPIHIDPVEILSVAGRPPLCGKTLYLARTSWVILAVISLGLFAISLPYHIIYLSSSLPMETNIALKQQGLSNSIYTGLLLLRDGLVVLGYTVTALAIFRTRSNDWITLFISLALLTFGVTVTSLEGASSPLQSLTLYRPGLVVPVALLRSLGLGMFLLVFYLFPDGLFVPRWTRPLAVIWGVWLAAWSLFNSHGNAGLVTLSPLVKFFLRMVSANLGSLQELGYSLRLYSLGFVLALWFGSGVAAQIFRYKRVSSPLQRHQTKFVVLGLVGAAGLYFFVTLLPPVFAVQLQNPGLAALRYSLVTLPISTLALLMVPISFNVAMHRFRLWDVDYLINRTLVYTGLTVAIGLFYVVDVLIVQRIFSSLAGTESTFFVVLSTLALAALFNPLRHTLQRVVDRRFFHQTVNFRQTFTSFAREIRTIIELPRLLATLVDRTTEILYVEYGAVYLFDDQQRLERKESQNLPADVDDEWQLRPDQLSRLRAGQGILQPQDSPFRILAPLLSPQAGGQKLPGQNTALLGVLALGPRCSGLPYGREDQALLLSLADQAGTAIYVARLIQEAQQEAQRRMEAEQSLENYRSSPLGQAEAMARSLTHQPETALGEIHQLAQKAGLEPDCASLVGNLSQALFDQDGGPLALLAEGYSYLYQSQFTPQLVPIGLRALISGLNAMVQTPGYLNSAATAEMTQARAVYRACLQAYEANSVAQIMDYEGLGADADGPQSLAEAPTEAYPTYLAPIVGMLKQLHPIAQALHDSERVDSPADKLAYLASAINGLRHLDHQTHTELGSADQPVLEQIAGSWLATVSTAMSELQTNARLVCRLLTRNTWSGDVVSLALAIQNLGRGAALQIKITLAPSAEYTLIDEMAGIERLAPGEEAEVTLRVRPRLTQTSDHFRARFVILYTDPRGPDQVENFADVVHLLATGGEFQFIPNPYVVGTPLKTGSPLFFGRQDVVQFIQSNLSASHRNNLVLIGQRRTGKTSLLKQLPKRLNDDILPVYLDGQTLGLDPGMSNFFLNLATEIAFALEDRGLALDPPTLEDFQTAPAAAFEKDFLVRVRQQIGSRHLLIMFDEFEELETAVRRGDLEASIFGFLRHLIQHQPNLSVIFCGTHRLEQLASDYWNILFNISLYQHIAYLSREEAQRLIQEPVAPFGMSYDDLALDKIWRITAGHPYFLQLLCHSLVNQHNKTERSYVTIADVNAALDDILASGEAHFVYMWTESSPIERLALTALSRLVPLAGQASLNQVIDFYEERGVTLERQAVSAAMHQLALRDILQFGVEGEGSIGEVFRWKLGLLGLWVEKYKSLSRVINEVAP